MRRLLPTTVFLMLILASAPPLQARDVTAVDLVSSCAEAMGGREVIDGVETLRFSYRLPDHGGRAHFELKRPNRMRAGNMLVFDGRRAALLDPPELVDANELKDFEMEIGWFFPAFFEHPAEYGGMETIDCIKCHRLIVRLPLGARLTYFLDVETHLPLMVESEVTVHGEGVRYIRRLGDFRETDGLLYPREFTYFSHHTKKMYAVAIDDLELNVPLDDERFAPPPGLLARDDSILEK